MTKATSTATKNKYSFSSNKDIFGVVLGTLVVLSIPFTAMLFTSEVQWDETDFLVIATLLLGMGMLFVFLKRMVRGTVQKVLIALGIVLVTAYIWAELAVGIFTKWGS